MIGILILSHGQMAEGLQSATNLIMGKQQEVDYLELHHETSIEYFKKEVGKKIRVLDTGKGVLVFCDLLGASPYNATASNHNILADQINFRCVTGVNLPMLIEAISNRELMNLDDLTKKVMQTGREGITEMFEILKKGRKHNV